MTNSKLCARCGEEKPNNQFYKNHRMKSGLSSYCKPCYSARAQAAELKRRWRKANLEKARQITNKTCKAYRKRYPERQIAKRVIERAIRRGDLIRQPCIICGITENVHAYHEDYSMPMRIIWLCRKCHRLEHSGGLIGKLCTCEYRLEDDGSWR